MQPSISWSSSVLVFVIESTAIIHSLKYIVLFSFVVPLLSLAVTHCRLLSLIVIAVLLAVTLGHFLYHSLSLVVICCHSLYYSLSFVVTRCHSSAFVVTRRHSITTRLSFYKRFLFTSLLMIFYSLYLN